MNLGNLSLENKKFVKHYKKVGYSTMTRLVDEAVTLLRNQKEKKRRQKFLSEAASQYSESYAWKELDGEDFIE